MIAATCLFVWLCIGGFVALQMILGHARGTGDFPHATAIDIALVIGATTAGAFVLHAVASIGAPS